MAVTNLGVKPGSIDSLQGLQNPTGKSVGGPGSASAEEFRKTLESLTGSYSGGATAPTVGGPAAGPGTNTGAAAIGNLKFSNHAVERMRSRGISFAPEQMTAIQNGIAKAAAKGSKDTLVLSGESALIVNVKNNTVVTVMDRAGMKDNVFTNIDSTVMV